MVSKYFNKTKGRFFQKRPPEDLTTKTADAVVAALDGAHKGEIKCKAAYKNVGKSVLHGRLYGSKHTEEVTKWCADNKDLSKMDITPNEAADIIARETELRHCTYMFDPNTGSQYVDILRRDSRRFECRIWLDVPSKATSCKLVYAGGVTDKSLIFAYGKLNKNINHMTYIGTYGTRAHTSYINKQNITKAVHRTNKQDILKLNPDKLVKLVDKLKAAH